MCQAQRWTTRLRFQSNRGGIAKWGCPLYQFGSHSAYTISHADFSIYLGMYVCACMKKFGRGYEPRPAKEGNERSLVVGNHRIKDDRARHYLCNDPMAATWYFCKLHAYLQTLIFSVITGRSKNKEKPGWL
jgi:hypothetical protein